MFQFEKAERFLRAANSRFESAMPLLTPTGVVLGLVLAHVFSPLKGAVTWLFAFLTFVGSMSVSVRDFASVAKRPKPFGAFALSCYIAIPLLASGAAALVFGRGSGAAIGFALLYSIPTAVVGTVWSGIYKGNGALSLALLVVGTFLSPLATPLLIRVLTRSDIVFDTTGIMVSLVWMVLIPSALGIAVNTATKGRCCDHVQPCLKPFTKIALLLVIIINTSQVADRLIADASWAYVPQFAFALCSTVLGFILSFLISKAMRLTRDDTVSVVFAGSMRNISAALVLAIDFFPPAASVPIIAGIVLQQSCCAVTSHFLFGAKDKTKRPRAAAEAKAGTI